MPAKGVNSLAAVCRRGKKQLQHCSAPAQAKDSLAGPWTQPFQTFAVQNNFWHLTTRQEDHLPSHPHCQSSNKPYLHSFNRPPAHDAHLKFQGTDCYSLRRTRTGNNSIKNPRTSSCSSSLTTHPSWPNPTATARPHKATQPMRHSPPKICSSTPPPTVHQATCPAMRRPLRQPPTAAMAAPQQVAARQTSASGLRRVVSRGGWVSRAG